MDPRVSPPQVYPQYDRDLGLPGLVAPSLGAFGTVQPPANRAYLARFVPSRNMVITAIGFGVSVAASGDDPCDVGLYAADGSKIVSAGATTGKLNGTGTKAITIASTSLVASTVYFAAFAYGTVAGTAATLGSSGFGTGALAGVFNAVAGTPDNRSIAMLKDASYVLPASFTLSTMTNTAAVVALAVKE